MTLDTPLRVSDTALPHLARALDPAEMSDHLAIAVTTARLVRHKPGKRALIRYETTAGPLLGKVRAGHRASSPFRLLQAFRAAGFTESTHDGIAVPEPVAVIEPLDLWVQRVVPGVSGETVVAGSSGEACALAARAAEAAHKIHRAGVQTKRVHGPADEGRILDDRLAEVAAVRPDLTTGIGELRRRSARLVDRLLGDDRPTIGIHRDYYADQLLIDDARLTVCDFDLWCAGDPAVDIGNFVAHLTEQALRTWGDPAALVAAEQVAVDVYCDLAGRHHRPAIHAYAALTLARHVSLSTQIDGRAHTTEPLLDLALSRPSSG